MNEDTYRVMYAYKGIQGESIIHAESWTDAAFRVGLTLQGNVTLLDVIRIE